MSLNLYLHSFTFLLWSSFCQNHKKSVKNIQVWFIELDLHRRYVTMNTPVMSYIHIYTDILCSRQWDRLTQIIICVIIIIVNKRPLMASYTPSFLGCSGVFGFSLGFWGVGSKETERNEWMKPLKKTMLGKVPDVTITHLVHPTHPPGRNLYEDTRKSITV